MCYGSKCEILIPSRCLPLCLRTRTLLDAVGTSSRTCFSLYCFCQLGATRRNHPHSFTRRWVERRDQRSVVDVKKRQSSSVRVTSSLPLKAQIGPAPSDRLCTGAPWDGAALRGWILKALRSLSSSSLMPKRFEGGISIQYKSCIRTSRRAGRARSVNYLGKEMANKIDRQFP